MDTDTAIIVINRNGKQHLEECFSSLQNQTFGPLRLYLVDNASTDGSVEFVRAHFPDVTILAMNKGFGFAGGYNRGIALVAQEFIGLISNDTVVDRRWTEYMRQALDTDPRIAVAGSKILLYDQPGRINSAGQRITPVGIGYEVGLGENDGPAFNQARDFSAVCGAGMMVRRSLFIKLGGFDDSYFLLCEDTDLCWRAWMAGYRVVYEPRAFLFHKFGATIGRRETPLRVYQIQRNSIASVIKNRQGLYLGFALAGCLLYACSRAAVLLITCRTKLLSAQLSGLGALIMMLPDLAKKRRRLQAQRVLSDSQMRRRGLFASWSETIREYIRIQKTGMAG
ncbi:MAG TPA: glycosyltransferase family 2 protein [Candidatus Omnitrophota bacterium]|nr:glycosyltransferase family 2 protein [Candidatus Omnitrophota bacterium]HQJ15361.1 glycosyltransferase family 2 protein [Candidatus Omnitrophota bacterium]